MAKKVKYIKYTAIGLPNGLTINENTGVITGTADAEPGEYIATITVETNYGSTTGTIKIKIEIPDAWKPVIPDGQIIYATADEEITPYQVIAENVTITN